MVHLVVLGCILIFKYSLFQVRVQGRTNHCAGGQSGLRKEKKNFSIRFKRYLIFGAQKILITATD